MVEEFARGDHLGEHHRRRLQRLDFLLGIGAAGAVLHDQHAERVAGAQDRHAEEGVIDLLASLRPVGKGRMRLRVREVDRARFARDQADQAFVGAHHGEVHGLTVQTFGRVQLQRAVDTQDIDRADLRDHVRGDQHDDLVEAFLRTGRLRNNFAKPTQQHARTAQRTAHRVGPSGRSIRPATAGSVQGKSRSGGTARRSSQPIANGMCALQAKGRCCTAHSAAPADRMVNPCPAHTANAGCGPLAR